MVDVSDMNKDILQVCKGLTSRMQVNYQLRSRKITAEEVFAEAGLMPAIAKRADQLSMLCFGHGIGVVFEDDSSSMLGVKAKFEGELKVSALLCIADTLIELTRGVRQGIVVLDELLFDVV